MAVTACVEPGGSWFPLARREVTANGRETLRSPGGLSGAAPLGQEFAGGVAAFRLEPVLGAARERSP